MGCTEPLLCPNWQGTSLPYRDPRMCPPMISWYILFVIGYVIIGDGPFELKASWLKRFAYCFVRKKLFDLDEHQVCFIYYRNRRFFCWLSSLWANKNLLLTGSRIFRDQMDPPHSAVTQCHKRLVSATLIRSIDIIFTSKMADYKAHTCPIKSD